MHYDHNMSGVQVGRLLEETTLGEFLQAVESVRIRESRESVVVANGRDAKEGRIGMARSMDPLKIQNRARRETTMPSLSGSVSR